MALPSKVRLIILVTCSFYGLFGAPLANGLSANKTAEPSHEQQAGSTSNTQQLADYTLGTRQQPEESATFSNFESAPQFDDNPTDNLQSIAQAAGRPKYTYTPELSRTKGNQHAAINVKQGFKTKNNGSRSPQATTNQHLTSAPPTIFNEPINVLHPALMPARVGPMLMNEQVLTNFYTPNALENGPGPLSLDRAQSQPQDIGGPGGFGFPQGPFNSAIFGPPQPAGRPPPGYFGPGGPMSGPGGSPGPPSGFGMQQDASKPRLTNAQLMNLIDELKEYNTRQASKIRSNRISLPDERDDDSSNSQTADAEDDDDDDSDQPNSEAESSTSTNNQQRSVAAYQKRPRTSKKYDAKDMAKFAKFLMSKEGSNVKFHLGLEKESPDDGDETEEPDTLLESHKNPIKTTPYDTAAKVSNDELNRKHKEVEQFVEHLTDGAKDSLGVPMQPSLSSSVLERRASSGKNSNHLNHKFKNARKTEPQVDTDDSSIGQDINMVYSNEPSEDYKQSPDYLGNNRDKDDAQNFAKMLIRQELDEDKVDNSNGNSNDADPSARVDKLGKRSVAQLSKLPRYKRKSAHTNHTALIHAGKLKSDSPSSWQAADEETSRNNERRGLSHQLDRARKTQVKMRGRFAPPPETGVNEAIKGLLGGHRTRHQRNRATSGEPRIKTLSTNLPDLSIGSDILEQQLNLSSIRSGDDNVATKSDFGVGDKASKGNSTGGNVLLDQIKIESAGKVRDEYPISEEVSRGLSKLSNNLDRYFNDGFIQEVEKKARAEAPEPKPDEQSKTVQQPDEEIRKRDNVAENKPKRAREKATRADAAANDQDFDVDVGIDGKRDVDRSDEDDSEDDGEDTKHSLVRPPLARSTPLPNRKLKRPAERVATGGQDFVRSRPARSRKRIRTQETAYKRKPGHRNSNHDGHDEQEAGLGEEYIGLTTNGVKLKSRVSSDPVENESMDTPIGDEPPPPPVPRSSPAKRRRIARSNVSKAIPGTRTKQHKDFYEEPEW